MAWTLILLSAAHANDEFEHALVARNGGFIQNGHNRLLEALQQAELKDDAIGVIRVMLALSDSARILADLKQAKQWLQTAKQRVEKLSSLPDALRAEYHFQRANLFGLRKSKQYAQARAAYQRALRYATDPTFRARILANQARLWVTACTEKYHNNLGCDEAQVLEDFQTAWAAGETLSSSEQTEHWLHLCDALLVFAQQAVPPGHQFLALADQWLREALRGVRTDRQRFYAYWYQSRLYRQAERQREALRSARQAWFSAQQTQNEALLYLACYHLGRLWQLEYRAKRKQGVLEQADPALNKAVHWLRQALGYWHDIMPQWLNTGYGADYHHLPGGPPFHERREGRLYYHLADTLLRQAERESSDALLQEAVAVQDAFKKSALVDYYRDDCLRLSEEGHCASSHADIHDIKSGEPRICPPLAADTVLFYPIIFKDRLELILRKEGRWIRISRPVPKRLVDDFHGQLQEEPNGAVVSRDTIQENAQYWFNTLIHPLQAHLRSVQSLIIIPDTTLLKLPFAALHDGEKYLVESHTLTLQPYYQQPTGLANANPSRRILLAAHPDLPASDHEVNAIAKLYPRWEKIRIQHAMFTKNTIKNRLANQVYDVIHIASHAAFDVQSAQGYLQATDANIPLPAFQRLLRLAAYRGSPADLLVLSACETALGDDRSVLGLAGSAVESRTRSVAASLWRVNDHATCVLMRRFHHYLRSAHGKSESLRLAQLDLLRGKLPPSMQSCQDGSVPEFSRKFSHPYYWAGFLLIGEP